MGNAVLDGRPFRIDPTSIAWEFDVNSAEHDTIGGKVVQVFGAKMGDLTIEGSFGVGGWQEQVRFLQRVRDLGEQQLDHWPNTNRDPYRFIWPSRGWDFKVWIRDYNNPEGSGAVEYSNSIVAPKWRLVLFIAEDNINLKKASTNAYISRLAAGIGWKQTAFNGPMDFETLSALLTERGVSDAREYLSVAYGLVTPTSQPSEVASGDAPADTEIKAYTQEQAAKRYGWTGAEWNAINSIVTPESGWDPFADNPTSTAFGLFQFLDSTWATVGAVKTTDWKKQVDAGLTYIHDRYETPVKALAFRQKHGWY